MNVCGEYDQLEVQIKADQLGITWEKVKKRENEQLMNIALLMGSICSN
jgi:hypothetical protein